METNHTKTEKKVEGFLGLSCQGAIHPFVPASCATG